jgi:CBS domain-containing protein
LTEENIMPAPHAAAEIVQDEAPLMLPSTTTLVQAAREMVNQNLDAVLVTEGDAEVIGIFTGPDAVTRVLAKGRDPIKTTLADVMTYLPVIMTPDEAAIEAQRLMERGALPAPDHVQKGKGVGLVSRGASK